MNDLKHMEGNRRMATGCKLLAAVLSTWAGTALAQSLPAVPLSETRSVSFVYDEVTGLLKEERIEPEGGAFCVSTSYGYDAYGNRVSTTTAPCTGATAPTTRSASSDFTTSTQLGDALPGSYLLKATNVLGDAERRKFDPRWGTATELVGPNGLKTTWVMDEFGRKVREVRADGGYTKVTYCFMTSADNPSSIRGECDSLAAAVPVAARPGGFASFVHTQAYLATGAVAGPWHRSYVDRLGREVRGLTQAFDGGDGLTSGKFVAVDTAYNQNGAKVLTTQPYFISSAGVAEGSNRESTDRAATFTDYDVLGRPVLTLVSDNGAGSKTLSEVAALPGYASVTATFAKVKIQNGDGTQNAVASSRFAVITVAYEGPLTTVTHFQPDGSGGVRSLSERTWRNPQGKIVLSQDAANAQTGFGYAAHGDLVTTVDPLGNRTDIRYDTRGRKIWLKDPNKGAWEYRYNALGEVVWQQGPNQRAKGLHTAFEYDALGRLVKRIGNEFSTAFLFDTVNGTPTGAACLDSASGGDSGGNNASSTRGKLCATVTTHGVRRDTTFDAKLRPLRQSTTVAAGSGYADRTFVQTTRYDAAGRPERLVYPTGLIVRHRYTGLGFLERIGNDDLSYSYWSALYLNARGVVEDALLGHGIKNRSRFDPLTGHPTVMGAGLGPDVSASSLGVYRHQFTWDSAGDLRFRSDDHGSGQGVATSETYQYDELHRLLQYTVAGQAGMRTVDVKYNALGSILARSDVGSFVYPASGSQVGATAGVGGPAAVSEIHGPNYHGWFEYDVQGNLVKTVGDPKYKALTYNSFNLPQGLGGNPGLQGAPNASGQRATYDWSYDDREQRIVEIKRSSKGTRTTWYLHPDGAGGLNYELEQDEAGNLNHRHFISAATGVVAVVLTRNGATTAIAKIEYLHRDHLGSTVAISSASTDGKSVAKYERYAYDPFGKRRYTSGAYDAAGMLIADHTTGDPYVSVGTDRGFTGHEHLDDVGVIHMNARLYDPLIGRFLQADPVVGDPFDLQSYNAYSYVRNRPLNTRDADGRCEVFCWTFIAIVGARATGIIDQNTFRQLMGIWVAAFLGPQGYIALTNSAIANAAIAGFASGVVSSGNLKGGLQGMFSSMVFYGVGQAANQLEMASLVESGFAENTNMWSSGGVGRAMLHAGGGCLTAAVSGGNCGRGGMTSGLGKLVTSNTPDPSDAMLGTVKAAMVGGTLSAMGGGKFANGAQTGAFQYLFNALIAKKELDKLYAMRGGHHLMPKNLVERWKAFFSDDAVNVFSKETVGEGFLSNKQDPMNPHRSYLGTDHVTYDPAVERLLRDFMLSKGINQETQMTAKQAYEFLDRIKASSTDAIKGYLDQIDNYIQHQSEEDKARVRGIQLQKALGGKGAVPGND